VIYFGLFSMRLSLSHDSGHKFNKLTKNKKERDFTLPLTKHYLLSLSIYVLFTN